MRGPEIIVRTLSVRDNVIDSSGRAWQYHSRSDHHSKVACWAVLFDLLQTSSLLQTHIAGGKVAFGINREISAWDTGRRKNLDLVIARSSPVGGQGSRAYDLAELAGEYRLVLDAGDRAALAGLPRSTAAVAGATVLAALEAKACMTAHVRALPRLYDELTSSYSAVHGDNPNALAIGFAMVNMADWFMSPGRQPASGEPVINHHRQPRDTERALAKIDEVKRRPGPQSGAAGFDALGAIVVEMHNDGSPVGLVEGPQAPSAHNYPEFQYQRMVTRVAHLYDSAFGHV